MAVNNRVLKSIVKYFWRQQKQFYSNSEVFIIKSIWKCIAEDRLTSGGFQSTRAQFAVLNHVTRLVTILVGCVHGDRFDVCLLIVNRVATHHNKLFVVGAGIHYHTDFLTFAAIWFFQTIESKWKLHYYYFDISIVLAFKRNLLKTVTFLRRCQAIKFSHNGGINVIQKTGIHGERESGQNGHSKKLRREDRFGENF